MYIKFIILISDVMHTENTDLKSTSGSEPNVLQYLKF